MQGIYHSTSMIIGLSKEERDLLTEDEEEKGSHTIKDSMSRVLLTQSFIHLLKGNIDQAEQVRRNVDFNCSSRIRDNRTKEDAQAKERAVKELLKREERKALTV